MYLSDGKKETQYIVKDIGLPTGIEKRLEALGMTRGTSVTVLNSKSKGILIVKVRGTRFALGQQYNRTYFGCYVGGMNFDEREFDNRLHREPKLWKDNTF